MTDSGSLAIQGASGLTLGKAGPSGNTGAVIFQNASNGNTVTLQSGTPAASFTLTLPTTKGNSGDCLQSDGTGALSFAACPGSGGVSSLDAQTGVLTLANSSGSAGTITINDASTTQKGIAQFNSTDFTASSGTIDTVQSIATSASPTFNGLTLTNQLTVANGGTGATTLTASGILYGNGAAAIQATAAAANSILATNGSNVPGLTQTLPTAVQGNITATGTLSAGSIAAGFGTISTANTITTTATVQGNILNATGGGAALELSGANINTAGTLSNVAYLNQNQTFSGYNTFKPTADSTTAFQIQNANGNNILNVDTTVNSNLVTNGGFESNVTGWAADGSAAAPTKTSAQQWQGNSSLSETTTAVAGDGVKYNYTFTNGQQYTLSFYIKLSSGTWTDANLAAGRADNGSTETNCSLNQSSGSTLSTTFWIRQSCTFTAGAQSGTPYFYIKQLDATARTFYIDGVQLQTGNTVTPFNPGGAIQLNGVIDSPVSIMPTQDSDTAFQVLNQEGKGFTVDAFGNLNSTSNLIAAGWLEGASAQITGFNSTDLLDLNHVATNVLQVTSTGAATFKNSTNSTTAFQIQGAGASSNTLLNADTSNNRLTVMGDTSVGNGYGTTIFTDNFESGSLGMWANHPNDGSTSIQTSVVHSGLFAGEINDTGGGGSQLTQGLPAASTTYVRAWVYVASQTTAAADLIRLGNGNNGSPTVWDIQRNTSNQLCVFYETPAVSHCGGTWPTGGWHEVELQITLGGTATTGTTNLWLDGTSVFSGSNTETNGTVGPTSIFMDNNGDTVQYYIDDVVVSSSRDAVSSSLNVTDNLSVQGSSAFNGQVHIYASSSDSTSLLQVLDNSQHLDFNVDSGNNGTTTIGTNHTVIQPAVSDTTTAFQVLQQSTGNAILNVDTQNGRIGINTAAVAPTADLSFGGTANRTINVLQATSGAGKSLTIQAGKSGTGANNGGNLVLQAGATGGTGTTGSVIVKANGTDSTTAFQIQNAAGTTTLFNADTTNSALALNANTDVGTVYGNTEFSDDFESGYLYNWSVFNNNTVTPETTTVHNGKWAISIAPTASNNFITAGLYNVGSTAYLRAWINVASQTSTTLRLMGLDNGGGNGYQWSVQRNNSGQICINNSGASTTNCGGSFTTGTWHLVELQITMATTSTGTTNLWLDGTNIYTSTTSNNGTPGGIVDVFAGDNNSGADTGVAYLDDIAVASVRNTAAASLEVQDSLHVSGNTSLTGSVSIYGSQFQFADNNSNSRFSVTTGAGSGTFPYGLTTLSTSGTLIKPFSDNSAAFQIQNANSGVLLNADTTSAASSNLVTNGGFESGKTGWSGLSMSSTNLTQTTTQEWQGNNSLSVATTTTANTGAEYTGYTLLPSQQYTLSFYAKVASGSITDFAFGRQDNTGTGPVDCSSSQTVTTNWTRFSCTFTTSATINTNFIYMRKSSTTAETFFIDGVQLQTGATATAFNAGGALQFNGVINSPLAIQDKSDNTNVFQIQNASGSQIFNVDTVNSIVSIGGQLSVSNNLTLTNGTVISGVADSGTAVAFTLNTNVTYATTDDLLFSVENNGTKEFSIDAGGHIITGGSTPGNTPGSGIGTGGTCAVTGDDTAGYVTVTTGTGTLNGSDICTINFATAFASIPNVIFSPGNGNASGIKPYSGQSSNTTGHFDLSFGTTPLTSSTYIVYYEIIK